MNSKTLLKCLCMCLAMFAILVNANAQDLKSILTGVAKAVVGDKATTSSSIYPTGRFTTPSSNPQYTKSTNLFRLCRRNR